MIARKLVLPCVLLALGMYLVANVGSTFSPPLGSPVKWEPLTTNPNFKIDMDAKSIKLVVVNQGYEVKTTLKMSFGQPIIVKDKKKVGAYYINEISAVCNSDTLKFEKSSIYSAEGELLGVGTDLGSLNNPHNSNSFITVWMKLSCDQVKSLQVPAFI